MVPDVSQTTVLRFADGDFVVPRWWASLPSFRRGPEYGDYVSPLPFTYGEAQAIASRDLERAAVSRAVGNLMYQHRRSR